jgi:predicted transposase YbfD/YdcC
MKKYFEEITDKRQQWKVEHKLSEIVIMTFVAVMSGLEIWEDIADYCRGQSEWFKEKMCLVLENGVASHDTFRRVFSLIKASELEQSFRAFVRETVNVSKGEIVGIDGKTVRGSGDKKKKAIHMVSAWASANKVVLGQLKTSEKSNEITAIPTLIELLELKGCIVTIDAMGCQKDITSKIIEAEADYVIGLKGNQEKLHEATKDYFESIDLSAKPSVCTEEKNGGRYEKREYWLENDIAFLDDVPEREKWFGLFGVGMVYSEVEKNGKITEEVRFFITSLTNINTFAKAVRSHWGIENSLHYCLDVTFHEDDCRIRESNSAENFSVIRHLTINALNMHPAKMSLARKRRKCQYDANFLNEVISIITA